MNSEVIDVIDPVLGSFSLSVSDINKPIWFGDYHTGKLSIFKAAMHGTPNTPCFGLIYVLTGQDDGALDGVGFAMYVDTVPAESAASHLLSQINGMHAEQIMKVRDDTGSTVH